MNREYIRDHQVIERYLRGALTPDEERGFEELYLGDPEILEELESAERLRQGLKALENTGGLERPRPKGLWLRAFSSPQYAVAASVLLAVTLAFSGALYRQNLSLREQSFAWGSATTRVVPIVSLRGAPYAISAPAEDELTVLSLDSGAVAYDLYRAVLERRGSAGPEEIWSRADLVPTPDGTILVGSGRALGPGEYEVLLEGRMDDWPAERFEEVSSTRLTVAPRD